MDDAFTDAELALWVRRLTQLQTDAQAHLADRFAVRDWPERDAALVIWRHAAGMRQGFERWLAARASRAALHVTSGG